ncbi:MAG: TetR/AcrR family transcriptional regulator [Proteobacteria bacterium]|nr:TetR/AcrR family transcriptional regulator [Pseudomonadota bacterium]
MSRKNIQDKRRQEILEALHKRLLVKPFDKTSIKEIAEEAGLNHGMLHYYFKSKEDILLAYIDYSIDIYRAIFTDWLSLNEDKFTKQEEFIDATLDFMAQKITLNRDLSKIFIEIWEIGIYNDKVKFKLQETYHEWVSTVTGFLNDQLGDPEEAKTLGTAIVAFSEGLSLLSIIFDESDFPIESLMKTFRHLFVSRQITTKSNNLKI